MMGYIFVIDFGRYINVNINHYRHGQTLTNLTGTNPIIAFFFWDGGSTRYLHECNRHRHCSINVTNEVSIIMRIVGQN